ncbi:short chain dehydrogenase/reductase family oxidoreductase [Purpureocillium lavendulum]|uniref:Short chain dehydrogenase/reductase family oxidoreductase n=1 Tax=Purpureocillium lavendulum TaxID=1247861 RepID=A0AB34FWB2_9HYPO|nr:short chain dehydrogenase/reductase family oxidoreductase [Purpureocillium lavendulum]
MPSKPALVVDPKARNPARGRRYHVTIFARRLQQLEEAKSAVLAARKHANQDVTIQSLDLTDAEKVGSRDTAKLPRETHTPEQTHEAFESQPRLPDILYCVAGGTTNELGFLVDLSADDVQRCMTNNYLTSAFPAQAMLKLWTDDDKHFDANGHGRGPRKRKIVFVSSAAAFVAFPGYVAYTQYSVNLTRIFEQAAKCAVRALADVLRTELMRYSGSSSQYSVHVAFPSNFISSSFVDEQKNKPALTRRLEGTSASTPELAKKLHSASQVAEYIAAAVDGGQYVICSEFEAALLFGGMVGLSPKGV